VPLYLLCGLAFSGKSTVAAVLARRLGALVVSLDHINAERGLEGGLGIPAEEWGRTHAVALERAEAGLAAGRPVVVDDTNCFRFLRDDHRRAADRLGVPTVVIHLDAPLSLILERLRANDRAPTRSPVTEAILLELAAKFEPPGPDESTLVVPAGADPEAWAARHLG
jgi:predicted kinase